MELVAATGHKYEASYDDENHFEKCKLCQDTKNIVPHTISFVDVEGIRTYSCECGYVQKVVNLYTLTIEYKYINDEKAKDSVVQVLEAGTPYDVVSPSINFMVADKTAVSGTINSDVVETVIYDYTKETFNNVERGQKFDAFMVDEEQGLSISYVIKGATRDWDETIVGETFTIFAGCLRARDSKRPAVYSADWYEATGFIQAWHDWNSLLNGEYLVTWSISSEGIRCYRNGILAFLWTPDLKPGGQWAQAGGDTGKIISDLINNIFTEVAQSGFEMGTICKVEDEYEHSATFDKISIGYAVDTDEALAIAHETYGIKTVLVNYVLPNGDPIAISTSFVAGENGEYSFAAPTIPGFLAQTEQVSGVLEQGQYTIDVVYNHLNNAQFTEPVVENKFSNADGWVVNEPVLNDKGITLATGLTGDFIVVFDAHFEAQGGWAGNTLLPIIQDPSTGDFALTRYDWYGHLFDVDGNGCTVGTNGAWGGMFVRDFERDYKVLIKNCDIKTTIVRFGETITIRTVFTPGENSTLPYVVYVLEQTITGCTASTLDLYATACWAKMTVNNVYAPTLAHTCTNTLKHDAENHWYECDICGEESGLTQHTPTEAIKENEVAATCTTEGSYESVVKCSVCNFEISRTTVTIDALGHSYVNGTLNFEDDSNEGTLKYTCLNGCGETKVETIFRTVAKYTGTTTTNMIEGNNARAIGLNEFIFSVVPTKNDTDSFVGLNKNGQIRLYSKRTTGGGSTLSISIANGFLIYSSQIEITSSNEATLVFMSSGKEVLENDGQYLVNGSGFSIQNTYYNPEATNNLQIYISSITIYYQLTHEHNYSSKVVDDLYNASLATCQQAATYFYSCEICGDAHDSLTFEDGTTISHDFTGEYLSDSEKHWHKCANCDELDAKESHSWDEGETTKYPTTRASISGMKKADKLK